MRRALAMFRFRDEYQPVSDKRQLCLRWRREPDFQSRSFENETLDR